jgi:hypothetical protein
MRFYSFVNYYLSGLQRGVQSFHAGHDMSVEYEAGTVQDNYYREWAKNHKTVIVLNGGNAASLQNLFEFFHELKAMGLEFPFVKFHEDEQSLNGALTSVGIVLTEDIYSTALQARWDEVLRQKLESQASFVAKKKTGTKAKSKKLEKQWRAKLILRVMRYELA